MVVSDHPYEEDVDLLQSTWVVVLAVENKLLQCAAVVHFHQNDSLPNQMKTAVVVKEVHDDDDDILPSGIVMSKVKVVNDHTCLLLQDMIHTHEQHLLVHW